MEAKQTIDGLLIYAAMGAYISGFVLSLVRLRRVSGVLFFGGFCFCAAGFVYRWVHVGHVPFQTLYEVFLSMGVLIWPLSIFSRRFLGVGLGAVDMLIGCIVLVPAGFFFEAEGRVLMPALQSRLFAPHVAVYMLSYVLMAKAAAQAGGELFVGGRAKQEVSFELGAYKMVRMGFVFMTFGLILGSWWGKRAWGDYWNWDPKEMWSLATWLTFLGYFHFRAIYGAKLRKLNSIWVLAGFVFILITLFWANLSALFDGLHRYG